LAGNFLTSSTTISFSRRTLLHGICLLGVVLNSIDTLFNFRRSVGMAIDYRLDDQMIRVRFLAGAGNFSPQHNPASYPVGTGCSFLGVKQLGHEVDHSPLSSAKVKESMELYLYSPNTSPWHGA
jgi:hypothetical protein